jgi:hypothetical protein
MSGGSKIVMSGSHGVMQMSMGGLSFKMTPGASNILPNWLAVVWTLVFLTVAVVHARHIWETRGERQLWHGGHVLMATGMIFMSAPPSLDHFGIPPEFWRLLFANAAGAIIIWALISLTAGAAVNRLWLVLAFDLAAMVYMWSPAGLVPAISWILVAYFAAQTVLWVTDRYRQLERVSLTSPVVGGDGTLVARVGSRLVCEHDLRLSMGVMVLGMAYMFAAMQLLT